MLLNDFERMFRAVSRLSADEEWKVIQGKNFVSTSSSPANIKFASSFPQQGEVKGVQLGSFPQLKITQISLCNLSA